MANRYAPLVLPVQLHDLPQDYQRKIQLFDAIGLYIAQQHVNRMNDYFELHEIDYADVRMRPFSQTLAGEVRTWFRNLATGSIADMTNFHRIFIERWGGRKTHCRYFMSMRTLGEVLKNQFKTTAPGLIELTMPSQPTSNLLLILQ